MTAPTPADALLRMHELLEDIDHSVSRLRNDESFAPGYAVAHATSAIDEWDSRLTIVVADLAEAAGAAMG